MSADADIQSPDALPIHDILRAITPVESSCSASSCSSRSQQRLGVVDELGPDRLPSTVARNARAIVLQRAPDDAGVHPPFDGAALLLAVDDETAGWPERCMREAGA